MRRCFSILLILFFGLGPLAALAEDTEDASLPSCCRRHGAHHCAMSAQMMSMKAGLSVDPTTSFSTPPTCPLYHGPALFTLMPAHALAAVQAGLHAEFTVAPAPASERMAAFSRPNSSHAVRGPPASNPI
jgi:hypothetical protein